MQYHTEGDLSHRQQVFISKKMSYALRHNPGKYGLKLDAEGYTDLGHFIWAMNHVHHFNPPLTEERIREIMHDAMKKRFAIKNGMIAALYGHSIKQVIHHPEAVPPAVLYHGTAHRFLKSIEREGLLPMERQYVHLSADPATAESVGRRRDNHPAILKIDAKRAHDDGIKFYDANDKVWLVNTMPAKYFQLM